ncbi:MAG: nitroreductase [Cardiobacteriaceae bacterium]|nr:nitroreductase [Cardiobacteriaceae bacterium]
MLDTLLSRRSVRKFTHKAPSDFEIELMLQAASQVPDHGNLMPYRFVVITRHQNRKRFQELLEQSAGDDSALQQKAKRLAEMSPLVIVVVSKPVLQGEVVKPKWEQELTAGLAAFSVQLAAKAQGYDSIWLSPRWAIEGSLMRESLGCGNDDRIIALLMIGEAETAVSGAKNTDVSALTLSFQ